MVNAKAKGYKLTGAGMSTKGANLKFLSNDGSLRDKRRLEVGFRGAFFFGSFLLGMQKK